MALFDTIRAGASGASGDYEVARSLRINDGDSPSLSRTPSSAGNQRIFTVSAWVKRTSFGSGHTIFSVGPGGGNLFALYFPSEQFSITELDGGSQHLEKNSSALFRDVTAWYHVMGAIDTTQSTAEDRIIAYINGVRITDYAANTIMSQNTDLIVNSTEVHYIGRMASGNYFDGYIAEFNFIDGQQLTPSSFAETDTVTGEYKPIKYTGSYGTNGFYLNFLDNSNNTAATLGKDSSGNGHNFTPNNLAATDSVKDSPTNNFCVWNTLDAKGNDSDFSEGNLKCLIANQSDDDESGATFAVSSGKWYWEEFMQTSTDNAGNVGVGVKTVDFENFWRVRGNGGESDHNGSQATVSGLSWTNGDIIGILLDLDDGSWKVSKNGTLIDTKIHTNVSGLVTPMMHNSNSSERHTFIANWGQDSSFAGTKTAQGNTDGNGQGDFYYSVPSGYLALCSKNLPEPTVPIGSEYFDTLLWTGTNAATTRDITGLDFSPDWVWIKSRSNSSYGGGLAYHHIVWDTVRGAGSNSSSGAGKDLVISLNTSRGEGSTNNVFSGLYGHVSSFNSDGFTVQKASGEPPIYTDTSGSNYVAWCWDAGSSTVTNTDGSTSAQVRANPSAGFSICTWTGTGSNLTIGHGLGVKPSAHITTSRTGGSVGCDWFVYLSVYGAQKNLRFNNTSVLGDTANLYNDTEPTSSVITIGNSSCINQNGGTYVTYVFVEVEGYSRFGKYTGNGNTDGTFVFTGFRPAWVLVKNRDSSYSWDLNDSKRDTDNVCEKVLAPNLTDSEATATSMDFLSNGFKLRVNNNSQNRSGDEFAYFAFAENPFKYARAR